MSETSSAMEVKDGRSYVFDKIPNLLAAVVAFLYRVILPANILDDAYITMRVARNIALGNGAVFNLGQRVYAITNPLWTLLNALPRILGFDSVSIIWVLGALSEIFLAIILVELAYSLVKSRWVGLLAVAVLFSNSVFQISSLGGMEIALSMASMVLAFYFINEKKPSHALITAAIGIWVRFDNLLLLGVVILTLILRRETRPRITQLIAPTAIILALIIGTWLYYGTPLPVSVVRKVAFDNSVPWTEGASEVLISFGMAVIGLSDVYHLGTLFGYIIPLFAILGLYAIIIKKSKEFLPLGIFTVVYMSAFILSGNNYASLFLWYFAPPLILTSLLFAVGIKRILEGVKLFSGMENRIIIGLAVVWTALMMPFNLADSKRYSAEILSIREKIYASTTIWFEKNIQGDFKIAAGEIGVIGFFARNETEIVDMVGLTRPIEDKRLPVPLIHEENVEGIIYWLLDDKKFADMQQAYPNYEFGMIQRTVIGLRKDLAEEILPKSNELMEIYYSLDMNREFKY
jgi:hypothetical protein